MTELFCEIEQKYATDELSNAITEQFYAIND